jgi:hypothetical protein
MRELCVAHDRVHHTVLDEVIELAPRWSASTILAAALTHQKCYR